MAFLQNLNRLHRETRSGNTKLDATITPHLAEMQSPNDVHFNDKGYDFLGEAVGNAIETQLTKH